MVTANAARVRRCEAAKRGKGLVEIRVWVPPDGIAVIRQLAADMVSGYHAAEVAGDCGDGGANG